MKIEQKIVSVEATCTKSLEEKVDEMLSKMNKNGYKLISMNIIPAKKGDEPDQHGMSYGTNEQMKMLFEKT